MRLWNYLAAAAISLEGSRSACLRSFAHPALDLRALVRHPRNFGGKNVEHDHPHIGALPQEIQYLFAFYERQPGVLINGGGQLIDAAQKGSGQTEKTVGAGATRQNRVAVFRDHG